mmetsp:Transcript_63428/g.100867  ORF Transcript_63428/g.100867 Transcript_63428/m.100867 type:complete len:132 (+) Transcript_63428:201-596(+)
MTEVGVETGMTEEAAPEGEGRGIMIAEIAVPEETTAGPETTTGAAEGLVTATEAAAAAAAIGMVAGIATEVPGELLGQEEGQAETGVEIGFARNAAPAISREEMNALSAVRKNQMTEFGWFNMVLFAAKDG